MMYTIRKSGYSAQISKTVGNRCTVPVLYGQMTCTPVRYVTMCLHNGYYYN